MTEDRKMPDRMKFGLLRATGENFFSAVIDEETNCEIIASAEYTRAVVTKEEAKEALDDMNMATRNLSYDYLMRHFETIRRLLEAASK